MANNPISQSNQVEFNDSVLTTKAWNSSRYDGRQLSATEINKFTVGDSTYGKTPVIQNYTRNIYIGNAVVGMNSDDAKKEDPNILQFDDFAYVQTNTFLTINEDDSISTTRIEDDGINLNNRTKFYQAFYDDFPEGGNLKLFIGDTKQKNRLKPSYKIYFNQGQFYPVFALHRGTSGIAGIAYDPTSNLPSFRITEIGGLLNHTMKFFTENRSIINEFYTGSLDEPLTGTAEKIAPILQQLDVYKDGTDYIGNKKSYLTFASSSGATIDNFEVIRTIYDDNLSGSISSQKTENLAELSTTEITGINNSNTVIQMNTSKTQRLNQGYNPGFSSDTPSPDSFKDGTYIISIVDDNTPSLLVELDKSIELPDDIGGESFVLIPENLHPYIKDNIIYFLTQAGIDVGGNASTLLKINPSNRLLK